MPNTKSAKKSLRQDAVRRDNNRSTKRALRTQCKKVLEAVEAHDSDKAQAELQVASKRLDQAAAKNTIHRNAAARLKSRLSAKVKNLKQTAAK
jgi:small subunit ribosomal protein S20